MHYVKTKLRVGGGGDHDDQWDYTSSEEEAEAPTQLFTDNQLNAINAIVRDPSIVRGGEIAGKDGHIDNELVDDTMAGFLRGFLNERWTAQLLAKLKSTNTYIALIVAAWLLTGTLYYRLMAMFTWPEALYFAVQAGLSIGFGASGVTCTNANWQEQCRIMKDELNFTHHDGGGTPGHGHPLTALEERVALWEPVDCDNLVDPHRYIQDLPGPTESQELCFLFTTIYVLLGASFVAVGAGLFVQNLIQSASSWGDEERQQAKAMKARLATSSSSSSSSAAPKQSDSIKSVKSVMNAATVAKGAVEALQHEVLNQQGEPVKSRLQRALPNKGNVMNYVAILWLVMGAVFAHFHMEFSAMKSIYYSFTALTTGGLEAPVADRDSMVFTAIYCLTGVPIYCVFLGSLAGVIAERKHREQLRSAIYAQIDRSDDLLAELRSFRQSQARRQASAVGTVQGSRSVSQAEPVPDEGSLGPLGMVGMVAGRSTTPTAAPSASVDLGIDYAEYLELILVRRGAVSMDELHQISARFDALDLDHDGTLSQTDIDVSNLFDRYDFNHAGLIDLTSFAKLCVDIIVVTKNQRFARQMSTKEDVEILFNFIDALDPAHKELISAQHFFKWWNGEMGGHRKLSKLSSKVAERHAKRAPHKEVEGDLATSKGETLAAANLAHPTQKSTDADADRPKQELPSDDCHDDERVYSLAGVRATTTQSTEV